MDKLIVVSCDGHIGAPVEAYGEYLDPKYRHLMPELVEQEKAHQAVTQFSEFLNDPSRLAAVDPRNRIVSGGMAGGWDVDRRLAELDAEGISAEVCLPGTQESTMPFFYVFNRSYPDELRLAGSRAYHRWAADFIAPSKGRLIGTADPGVAIDDATIRELSFVAERGFGGVYLPNHVQNKALPPLIDPYFERFWAACNDLSLVLTIHVGWGQPQGNYLDVISQIQKTQKKLEAEGHEKMAFSEAFEKVMSAMRDEKPDSSAWWQAGPRRAVWQIIFSGVFDRYPKLKLQVAEARADWVPDLKADLDQHFLAASARPNLKLKPSEYFGRNIFVTPSSPRRREVGMRHEIGIDTFMFGADFPHPESTWPNTLSWLRAAFHDVPENELRQILGENAIGVYGLDKEMLKKVAARIGPRPSDIIGDGTVEEGLLVDFDKRAHYLQATPTFSLGDLNALIDEDLKATAA
jgi:predicted TIM-barrel fold metal-dependent hydrolase